MTENSFEPKNELEETLLAAQEGRIDSQAFIDALNASQVFMPVQERHQIANFQVSDKAKPLTLEAEDGSEVLILFTSPERAKDFLEDFPDYKGGLLAEFPWVLERVGSGISISINPDSEVGLDMSPDMLAALRS